MSNGALSPSTISTGFKNCNNVDSTNVDFNINLFTGVVDIDGVNIKVDNVAVKIIVTFKINMTVFLC